MYFFIYFQAKRLYVYILTNVNKCAEPPATLAADGEKAMEAAAAEHRRRRERETEAAWAAEQERVRRETAEQRAAEQRAMEQRAAEARKKVQSLSPQIFVARHLFSDSITPMSLMILKGGALCPSGKE